ncbi:MAG: P-II family nitrogen regulator [Candidatus Brocadiaceae bacterium]
MGYPGLKVIEVKGRGNQKGISEVWRGTKYQIDLLSTIMIEITVNLKRAVSEMESYSFMMSKLKMFIVFVPENPVKALYNLGGMNDFHKRVFKRTYL